MPALNKLYEQYGNKVTFMVVYITEAHPSDVWQMQSNIKDKVIFASPKNEEERAFLAGACVRKPAPAAARRAPRTAMICREAGDI